MGVLSWLFGRSSSRRAASGNGAQTSEAASAFATPTDLVELAIDQILAEVDAPEQSKQRVRRLFVEAHRSGNPRNEVEAVEAALRDVSWGEKYFGAWRRRFEAEGGFPYMWEVYGKKLRTEPAAPPSTAEQALELLRVPDMRELAASLEVMPAKGRPRKRAEFAELLLKAAATEDIIQAALPRHAAVVNEHLAARSVEKCAILAHTLTMRCYALQRSRCGARSGKRKLRPSHTDCPVEAAYAARFMAGKIRGEPPFFPGDRTGLIDTDD